MKVDFLIFSEKSCESYKKFSLKALKLTGKSVKIYIPRKNVAAPARRERRETRRATERGVRELIFSGRILHND